MTYTMKVHDDQIREIALDLILTVIEGITDEAIEKHITGIEGLYPGTDADTEGWRVRRVLRDAEVSVSWTAERGQLTGWFAARREDAARTAEEGSRT